MIKAPGGKPPGDFFFAHLKPRTVGTVPFPRKQRRLSPRYYLLDGDVLWRVPHRLHRALLSGMAVLPQYANSKQKGVKVLIWSSPRIPPKVEMRGSLFSFNSMGSIDLADAAEL